MGNLQEKTPKSLPTPDKDTAMKQYQLIVDIHKFYFEMALKFLVFHYAVTGAILSYYLSQPNTGVMRFALIFPIFMSLIFSAFAFFGSLRIDVFEEEMLRNIEVLGVWVYPDPRFLKYLLRVVSLLALAIVIALIVISILRPVD
jgi:hypothetical protein